MKKYFFITAMLGLLFMGCSVDNDELNFNEDQIQTANLEINEVCMPLIYKIEDSEQLLGNVIITNSDDGGIAYINFISETGFYITEIRWMVADDLSGLPNNNGGIIPGKLEKLTYDSVSEVNFEYAVSNSLVLAARVKFVDESGQTNTFWIGDNVAGKNNSKFLDYTICIPHQEEVCEADAGTDQLREYTLAEIDALVYSPTSLADVYITLLDEGISTDGTFSDRTMTQLLTTFAGNRQYSREYTTTYTVTNTLDGVECSDSAKLTIRVLDDRYSN